MRNTNYDLSGVQQKFNEFYNENLRYKYEQLEPIRKNCLRKFWIYICLYLFVAGAVFGSVKYEIINADVYDMRMFRYAIAFANLVFIFLVISPFNIYKARTKSLVMNKILSFWGDFKYTDHGISKYVIEKSEIFALFDSVVKDDSFIGKYNNTNISVSETELLIKGNRGSVSVFKGVIMLLEFNKKFKGKTIVKNRGNILAFCKSNLTMFLFGLILFCSMLPAIMFVVLAQDYVDFLIAIGCFIFNIFLFYLFIKKMKKKSEKIAKECVNLEDICFNRKWKIYTDDQIEARYILTPILMEKINNIKKLFHGKYIDFGFFDNSLMIAVHTNKNMFETTSLFTPSLDYEKVKDVVYQLHSIFSVIDVLGEKQY